MDNVTSPLKQVAQESLNNEIKLKEVFNKLTQMIEFNEKLKDTKSLKVIQTEILNNSEFENKFIEYNEQSVDLQSLLNEMVENSILNTELQTKEINTDLEKSFFDQKLLIDEFYNDQNIQDIAHIEKAFDNRGVFEDIIMALTGTSMVAVVNDFANKKIDIKQAKPKLEISDFLKKKEDTVGNLKMIDAFSTSISSIAEKLPLIGFASTISNSIDDDKDNERDNSPTFSSPAPSLKRKDLDDLR